MDPNNSLILSVTSVSKLKYAFLAQNHEFKVTMLSMLILWFQAIFPCGFAVFPKDLCGFTVFATPLTPLECTLHHRITPSPLSDAVGPKSSQRTKASAYFRENWGTYPLRKIIYDFFLPRYGVVTRWAFFPPRRRLDDFTTTLGGGGGAVGLILNPAEKYSCRYSLVKYYCRGNSFSRGVNYS